jgi:hypothetical protein
MKADVTTYPVLASGIIFAPVDGGCVALGGPRDEYFSGATASTLLPKLPPLLAGKLTVPQIATALGIDPATGQQIVDFLTERGLIQAASAPAADSAGAPPMRTFLQRTTPGGHGAAMAERLARASIWVTGTGPLADRIGETLKQSGVGSVARWPEMPGAFRDASAGVAPDLVIAVSKGQPDGPAPAAMHGFPGFPGFPGSPWNQVPWLRVHAHRGRIWVGPVFNLPGAACPHCFSHDGGQEPETSGQVTGTEPMARLSRTGLAAGIAAGAALRCVGGPGTPSLRRGLVEVFSGCAEPRERPLAPRPDCPGCGRPGVGLPTDALAELEYELGLDPAGLAGHLQPFSSDGDTPDGPSRRFLIEPRMLLRNLRGSGTGTSRARPATAGTGEALTAVCAMLGHSVGTCPAATGPRTGQMLPSWAPSAGGLRTTHAYAFCDASAAGTGSYYFDGLSNELVVLSHVSPPDGLVPPGGACVVLVGDLAAARRLGPAARRVAYQDAGMAAAHVYACGRALGWQVRVHPGAAAEVTTALELDPAREVVALILAIHQAGGTPGITSPADGGAVTDRSVTRLLRRHPLTYRFAARPPGANAIARVMSGSAAGTADLWGSEPDTTCLLYARNVRALPRGLYLLTGRTDLAESQAGSFGSGPLETYLADRDLDPPALLLLTGDLPGTLAAAGAAGFPALVAQSGAAAGLARLGAAAEGLSAGLFARLPPSLISASLAGRRDLHRVFYGAAVGRRPAAPAQAAGGAEW